MAPGFPGGDGGWGVGVGCGCGWGLGFGAGWGFGVGLGLGAGVGLGCGRCVACAKDLLVDTVARLTAAPGGLAPTVDGE